MYSFIYSFIRQTYLSSLRFYSNTVLSNMVSARHTWLFILNYVNLNTSKNSLLQFQWLHFKCSVCLMCLVAPVLDSTDTGHVRIVESSFMQCSSKKSSALFTLPPNHLVFSSSYSLPCIGSPHHTSYSYSYQFPGMLFFLYQNQTLVLTEILLLRFCSWI